MPDPTVKQRLRLRGRTTPYNTTATASREIHWIARGYADEDAAETAVKAETPPKVNGIPLASIELVDEPGDGVFGFVAKYQLPNAGGTNGGGSGTTYDYNWTTGQRTFTRTQSLDTTRIPPIGKTVDDIPDFEKAILVQDGSVDGVECEDGAWEEEITFWLLPENVTTNLKRALFELKNTVNNADFLYFREGECRFRGAWSSARYDTNTEITLRFSAASNEIVPATDILPEINKFGQDFLWYHRTTEFKDIVGGGKYKIAKPVAAYMEQIYPRKSFDLLAALIAGIGTGGYAWDWPE